MRSLRLMVDSFDKLAQAVLERPQAGDRRRGELADAVTDEHVRVHAERHPRLRDRHLEGSNVSAVEEMVATMSLNRSFEMQMKVFKASDSMTESGNRLLGT